MSHPSEAPKDKKKEEGAESYERAAVDTDGSKWAEVQEGLIAEYKHIVALRGAGTNNGIDKAEANRLVEEKLIPRLRSYLEDGGVAVLFDGDEDNLDKPDIGFIMGRLTDEFGGDERAAFVTAQKQSWYYPPKEGSNLANANGREYKTVVFPDNKFPGDHNSFTQSERLAAAEGYEQWYVGASGPIASEQLEDLNGKVPDGKRKAVLFRAPINEDLTGVIQGKVDQAREAGDEVKAARFEGVLEQRQNKYGVHFDNEGNLNLDPSQFEHLELEVA